MTLKEALAEAYSRNPSLLSEQAAVRAADEGVPQALSNWRPTIEASADYGASNTWSNAADAPARSQNRNPRSMDLTVSQPIYRGGRTIAETEKAEAEVQGERATLRDTEQTVLLSAATAYVNVMRDLAVLELKRNNEQVLLRQLEATRDRFEVGEITRTDVSQAEARVAKANAERIRAEGDLESTKATFRKVVGTDPVDLQAVGDLPALPASLDDSVALALENNPSVAAAQHTERAANHNVRAVKGELLPTVSLTGTASRSFEASSETSRADSYSAVVSLSVPLYQSGSVYSRLREAKETASQQRLNLEQARLEAIELATDSWQDLVTTQAQIKSITAQIRAAEIALEGVQREASVGSRTVLDVLDAEQELLDARVSLVEAERDEKVAALRVMQAVGRLNAQELELPVQAYDPARHYEAVRGKWFGGSLVPSNGE